MTPKKRILRSTSAALAWEPTAEVTALPEGFSETWLTALGTVDIVDEDVVGVSWK